MITIPEKIAKDFLEQSPQMVVYEIEPLVGPLSNLFKISQLIRHKNVYFRGFYESGYLFVIFDGLCYILEDGEYNVAGKYNGVVEIMKLMADSKKQEEEDIDVAFSELSKDEVEKLEELMFGGESFNEGTY